MTPGLLLFALVDAGIAARVKWCAFQSEVAFRVQDAHEWAAEMECQRTRLGQWRALWWG